MSTDNQSSQSLSIYGYTDYRSFLKDFYAYRKDSPRGYSYRSFSKAAGFSAPNVLKLVIEGQRNISQQACEKFVKALGLRGNQAQYFCTLVLMNQSKDDSDKDLYLKKLERLTPRGKRRQLNAETHQYLSHWLYPVLREMINLPNFRADSHWIVRRLNDRASVQEVDQALNFLIKQEFIVKDGPSYRATDKFVLTEDEVSNLAIRNYHRQMIEQAKKMLEALPLSEREFGALTLLIPEAAMGELKERLKSFRKELHTWAVESFDDHDPETVVQLNLQMYPHTKRESA